MTREVTCSIIFGTLAAALTLVAIVQSFLQRPARGMSLKLLS